jgi:hypothetical protein
VFRRQFLDGADAAKAGLFVAFGILFLLLVIMVNAAAAVAGWLHACGKVPLSQHRRSIEEAWTKHRGAREAAA